METGGSPSAPIVVILRAHPPLPRPGCIIIHRVSPPSTLAVVPIDNIASKVSRCVVTRMVVVLITVDVLHTE